VASAADPISAQDGLISSGAQKRTNLRPNPVALEIPVLATGTRPSEAPGQRDLFTEETSTVLVFRDGAVIRLAAAVALGQLVFLTNKQTKREVVCQVLRKRSPGPEGCYAELDFTEDMPNFWGVEFPVEDAVKPRKVAISLEPTTEGKIQQASGPGDEHLSSALPAPSAQEVDHLRLEVETLRNQLQSLLTAKEVPDNKPSVVPTTQGSPSVQAETPAWARAVTDAVLSGAAKETQKLEVMSTTEPAPLPADSPTTAVVAPEPVAVRKRPAPFAEEEAAIAEIEGQAAEESLPQPALDFSKASNAAKQKHGKSAAADVGAKPANRPIIRILALVALLAVGGAAAWYENLLPFLPRTKDAKTANVLPGTNGKTAGKPSGNNSSSSGTKTSEQGANSADSKSGAPLQTASSPAGGGGDSATAETTDASMSNEPREAGADVRRGDVTASLAGAKGKKHSQNDPGESAETELPESAINDGSVVPARLLKSVNAVYPPDAMLNYITGDVIIDAVVHANGQVGEMKVLTGPAALREAATAALKQYQYQPATEGGKAVASHVKVTVKFWFNP
jgi:TonB family protein